MSEVRKDREQIHREGMSEQMARRHILSKSCKTVKEAPLLGDIVQESSDENIFAMICLLF